MSSQRAARRVGAGETPAAEKAAGRAKAARSGIKGEKVFAEYAEAARQAGIADLVKVPTPTAGYPLRYVKASTVDFVGFLLDGTARFVAVEVKTCTSKPRFALSEVEPHQRDYLDRVMTAGGVAMLAVVWKEGVLCVVPWESARESVSLGHDELMRWVGGAAIELRRHWPLSGKTSTAPAEPIQWQPWQRPDVRFAVGGEVVQSGGRWQ